MVEEQEEKKIEDIVEQFTPKETRAKPNVEPPIRHDELIEVDVRLKTCLDLDPLQVGHLEVLKDNRCKISLVTTKSMQADHEHMVHSGYIAAAAEYAALAAINEPNGMIFSVSSHYLACARVGDEITIDAHVRHIDTRKRDVDVVAKINSIKIYDARIVVVIPEYHPLKIRLMDVAGVKE